MKTKARARGGEGREVKGDRKRSLLLPLFSPLPSFRPSFQKENCSVNCLQSAFSFKIRPVLIPVSIYRRGLHRLSFAWMGYRSLQRKEDTARSLTTQRLAKHTITLNRPLDSTIKEYGLSVLQFNIWTAKSTLRHLHPPGKILYVRKQKHITPIGVICFCRKLTWSSKICVDLNCAMFVKVYCRDLSIHHFGPKSSYTPDIVGTRREQFI